MVKYGDSMMAYTSLGCSLKGHVLVGGEESHELWHLDDLNESGSVDIEMSPSFAEVGLQILVKFISGKSLMGVENFSGSSSCD